MVWYCVPGLGADESIFQKLNLSSEFKVLRWVEFNKEETVAEYAKRMCLQINSEQEFGLIGVSFGGLVVNEMDKLIPAKKVILISSGKLKTRLKNALTKHLLNLVPIHKISLSKSMVRISFGPEKTSEETLFKIIDQTHKLFLEWALRAIQKYDFDRNYHHYLIIGNKDFFFKTPRHRSSNDIVVKGGTHFLIYDRADEVSFIINSA